MERRIRRKARRFRVGADRSVIVRAGADAGGEREDEGVFFLAYVE